MKCNLRVCIFILLLTPTGHAIKKPERYQQDGGEDRDFKKIIPDLGSGMFGVKHKEGAGEQPPLNPHYHYEWNKEESSGSGFNNFLPITADNNPAEKNNCVLNICKIFDDLCPDNQICTFDLEMCTANCACPQNMDNCKPPTFAPVDRASSNIASGEPPYNKPQHGTKETLLNNKLEDSPSEQLLLNQKCADTSPASCPLGFPCIHGECVYNPLDYGAYDVYCECSPGWIGMTCDTCCSLDCVHGNCEILDRNMTCACEWGYEGGFCENEIAKPTVTRKHTYFHI